MFMAIVLNIDLNFLNGIHWIFINDKFCLFVLVFVSWKNDSVVDNNDNEEEENKFKDKIRTRT